MKKILLVVVLSLLLVSFVSGTPVEHQFLGHPSHIEFEECSGGRQALILDNLPDGFIDLYQKVTFGDGQRSDYEVICKYSNNETKCLECADEAIFARAIEKVNENKFQQEKQSQDTISNILNYSIYVFILFIILLGIYKVNKWQVKTIWRILLLIIFILVLLFLLAIPILRMIFVPIY